MLHNPAEIAAIYIFPSPLRRAHSIGLININFMNFRRSHCNCKCKDCFRWIYSAVLRCTQSKCTQDAQAFINSCSFLTGAFFHSKQLLWSWSV